MSIENQVMISTAMVAAVAVGGMIFLRHVRKMIRQELAAARPGGEQFPIASIVVRGDGSTVVSQYAPGLPPGRHDVYLAAGCTPMPPPRSADDLARITTTMQVLAVDGLGTAAGRMVLLDDCGNVLIESAISWQCLDGVYSTDLRAAFGRPMEVSIKR